MARLHPNVVAYRACRSIVGAARPFTVEVVKTPVTVAVSPGLPRQWPTPIDGLDPETDGPWPSTIEIDATWDGGRVPLRLDVRPGNGWPDQPSAGLELTVPGRSTINWVGVARYLADADDGEEVALPVYFGVRSVEGEEEARRWANARQLEQIAFARLPLLGEKKIELCRVEVPDGTVRPSAEEAFRRFVTIGLYKVDYMDLRPRPPERGRPLIQVPELEGSLAVTALPTDDDEKDRAESEELAPKEIPLNLILYGPPGTGKTYEMQHALAGHFAAPNDEQGVDEETVADLTWFEVVAAALHELGGRATVPELKRHPLVRAKGTSLSARSPLGVRLWATLQSHTIEGSRTVAQKARAGELVFDKTEASEWIFAGDPPESSVEFVESLRGRAS